MYEGEKDFFFGNHELLKTISVYISHTSHVQSLWVKDFRAGHKTVKYTYMYNNYCTTPLAAYEMRIWLTKKSQEYSIAHNNVLFVWFWYLFPVSQLQWTFLFICYLPFDQILGLCYAWHSLTFTLIIDIKIGNVFALHHTALSWIFNFAHFISLVNLRYKGDSSVKVAHILLNCNRNSKFSTPLVNCFICILNSFQYLDFDNLLWNL
jgi:hypothetical protein